MDLTHCSVCGRKSQTTGVGSYGKVKTYCPTGCYVWQAYTNENSVYLRLNNEHESDWYWDEPTEQEKDMAAVHACLSKMKAKLPKDPMGFYDTLRQYPYDQVTRLVFADWLNEQGRDDEAEVQRSWTKDKQEADETIASLSLLMDISKRELLAYGEAASNGEGFCFSDDDAPDVMYDETFKKQFWDAWERLHGTKVEEEYRLANNFRCAC